MIGRRSESANLLQNNRLYPGTTYLGTVTHRHTFLRKQKYCTWNQVVISLLKHNFFPSSKSGCWMGIATKGKIQAHESNNLFSTRPRQCRPRPGRLVWQAPFVMYGMNQRLLNSCGVCLPMFVLWPRHPLEVTMCSGRIKKSLIIANLYRGDTVYGGSRRKQRTLIEIMGKKNRD